jgi:outer membrane receptor protein involved in Fe transport
VNHFGRVEANLISDFQISDNLSTMILGNGNFFNQEIDHNGDSFLDKPMMSQLNLMNRWKYQGEVWESISGAKVLLENRKGGQSGFYILNDPKLYGIKINTQRFEFFSKNGFVFPGDKYRSLGTIVSAIYHKQNSFFGSNEYDANQFSIYTSIVYQSVLDEANQDISIEESFEKSEHKYSLGFSFILDNYNEDINGKINKRIESVPGFFAEYAFGGIPDLNIIGGLRADYHNLYGLFFTPRLHIKYQLSENTVFRASAGKGYRVSRIYAENSGLFASSRLFFVDEELKPEVAWNFGLNSSTDFFIGDILFTLNAEYYRTDFINQVIIDTDRNPGEVHFYNLKGKSYSNSFQVDLIFEPISGLNIMTAYRLNDVKMTIYDELLQKPLLSKHKAFLNIGYAIGDNDWLLDFTADYNGRGRLPNTSQNPEEYRLNDEFEDFILFNTQITKKFDVFEMYLGIENITDYKQKNPILGYNDPNGKYFDSTIIWGPIIGRLVYFGFRLNIN